MTATAFAIPQQALAHNGHHNHIHGNSIKVDQNTTQLNLCDQALCANDANNSADVNTADLKKDAKLDKSVYAGKSVYAASPFFRVRSSLPLGRIMAGRGKHSLFVQLGTIPTNGFCRKTTTFRILHKTRQGHICHYCFM